MAENLLGAVGKHAWVDEESKIDSLTGVTGSGPAYVFLLIEALAAAGVDQDYVRPSARYGQTGYPGRSDPGHGE